MPVRTCRFLVASLLSWVLPPAALSAAGGTCPAYGVSGPITVTHDNQVVSNLVITSDNGPAIQVNGFSGVRIVNVVIHHGGGAGVALVSAPSLTIANADIVFDGAPAARAPTRRRRTTT